MRCVLRVSMVCLDVLSIYLTHASHYLKSTHDTDSTHEKSHMHTYISVLTDTRQHTRHTTLSEPCSASEPCTRHPDPLSGGSSHAALKPEGLKGGALPASLQ